MAWKRFCPHTSCPYYKGKGINCDRTGQHCEIINPGKGIPGLYPKQFSKEDLSKTDIEHYYDIKKRR